MPDESVPSPFAKAIDLFGQVGNDGLYKNVGYNFREPLAALRYGPRANQTWLEMGNDPIVAGVISQIVMILRRVTWDVEASTTDNEDIARAEFLESVMDDMTIPWEQVVADALTMLDRGFSYLEIVYKRRLGPTQRDGSKRSDHNDGKIGIRKLVPIAQETIVDWEHDDTGGVQGAWQAINHGRVLIPIDKALLFRTDYTTPWGRSILRAAYKPWYEKKNIEAFECIGIERDLVGIPVAELRGDIYSDAGARATWQKIVTNLRNNEQAGVTFCQAYDEQGNPAVKFYLLPSPGAKQIDLNPVLDRKTRDIAISMLQDVLLLGHLRVGTQALAAEKRDLSEVALRTWLHEVENVVNTHLVPRLLEMNGFPLEDPPRVVPGDLRQQDIQAMALALRDLGAAGINLIAPGDGEVDDLNFLRRYIGLPPIDPQDFADAQAAPPVPPPLPPAVPPSPDQTTMPDGSEMPQGQ